MLNNMAFCHLLENLVINMEKNNGYGNKNNEGIMLQKLSLKE